MWLAIALICLVSAGLGWASPQDTSPQDTSPRDTSPQDAASQDEKEDPTFKVDVNLVHVLATVKGPNGAPMGDLGRDEFTVVDGGKEREIVVFERQTNRPLSVAMMVDTSSSTGKEIQFEKESAKRFAKNLLDSDRFAKDRLSIFRFSVFVELATDFTNKRKPIQRALDSLSPDSGTSMYDAILLAAGQLGARTGRRVMVIITDGGDTSSRTTFHKALEHAQRIDAVIYGVIVMPIKADAGRNVGGENALKTLAANTGGATFVQFGDVDLDQAFDEILRSLRTQYLIGYYPPEHTSVTQRFRPVAITVSRPDATVLARNGYFVPEKVIRRNSKDRIGIRARPVPSKPASEIDSRTGTKRKGQQP